MKSNAKWRIYADDGTFFGVYEGGTAEEAFRTMLRDGGAEEPSELTGIPDDWDIELIEDQGSNHD